MLKYRPRPQEISTAASSRYSLRRLTTISAADFAARASIKDSEWDTLATAWSKAVDVDVDEQLVFMLRRNGEDLDVWTSDQRQEAKRIVDQYKSVQSTIRDHCRRVRAQQS